MLTAEVCKQRYRYYTRLSKEATRRKANMMNWWYGGKADEWKRIAKELYNIDIDYD